MTLRHLILIAAVCAPISLQAGTFTWNLSGGGIWDSATANWNNGGVTTWINGASSNASIGDISNGGSVGAITLAQDITAGSVAIGGSGNDEIDGGGHALTVSSISGLFLFNNLTLNLVAANASSSAAMSQFGSGTNTINAEAANSLNGNQMLGTGTMNLDAANAITAGLHTLGSTAVLNANVANAINQTVTASSNAQFTLNGLGVLNAKVTGAVASGRIDLNGNAMVSVQAPNALSSSTRIYLQGGSASETGGTLRLNGNATSVGEIYGNNTNASLGVVENASAVPTTLNVNYTPLNANLEVSGDIFSGVIRDGAGGGALQLLKTGTGKLTLTGANTYTGGTVIQAGTVQVGNSLGYPGTTGSIAGDIVDNSHLIFNRSNNLTYSGVISGTGDVTQSGAGVLTLAGISTYSGATLVTAGTLNLTGEIGVGAALTVASGATLNGSGTILRDVTINAGGTLAGTLQIAGQLTLPAASQQNVGSVSSGTTTATTGQQLVVTTATGGTIDASAGTASVATLAGASLTTGNWGASVTTLTSGSVSSTGGGVNVTTLNGGALTLANGATVIAQQGNFSGSVQGDGSLVKTGAGTLSLNSANSYTRGTEVTGGTLIAAVPGATGAAAVQLSNGGQFQALGGGVNVGGVVTQSPAATYQKTFASGGETLADFGSFASSLGGTNTAAAVQGASASSTTLSATYAAGSGTTTSDQLTLSGLDGTPFLLTLKIDPSLVSSSSYLGWLDPHDGTWKNAVLGNHGASGTLAAANPYLESSTAFLDGHGGFDPTGMLGAYGVNTITGEVWAVIDHNSTFGTITTVPEPSTGSLTVTAVLLILAARRLERRSPSSVGAAP
jgi:autotransporter-associated beta strand protein